MGWARLLKRVFDINLEHCPQCGGDSKIIAAIEEPAVIVRILTHLGLTARAPPRAGHKVLSLRTVAGRGKKTTPALCAETHGFSLHAGVRCDAHRRKELERLCRYFTRPAIANERQRWRNLDVS
jgi:hypothetical protein